MKKRSALGTFQVKVSGETFSGWAGWVGQASSALRLSSAVEGSAGAASSGFGQRSGDRATSDTCGPGAGLERVSERGPRRRRSIDDLGRPAVTGGLRCCARPACS